MKIRSITSKKAIAFSFLAFFISIIIFAFLYLNMSQNEYTKDNVFKKSRIEFIDSEIKYFKETYLKSAVSYSLYNTLDELLLYINRTGNNEINQNYTRFRELVYEGMYYGNFSDGIQPNLINKTLIYFIDTFEDEFNLNYKGNFTYTITNINVYEETPYYLTVQVDGIYNITTIDNLSNWNFEDSLKVSLPIYDLLDPELFLQGDKNVKITPSEFVFGNGNWTLNTFKEAINNSYTTIFIESEHEYTIGNSYLNRLLNISRSSYKNVIGYWNFNLDEKKEVVFDSSLNSNFSKHKGNSRLIYNFDSGTINASSIRDISSYNSNGSIFGVLNCSVWGSKNQGCFFNNSNYINISNQKINLSDTNKITISAWLKVNADQDFDIFKYGESSLNFIKLSYDAASNKINFRIGKHDGGSDYIFVSNSNLSIGNWTQVIASFDGDTGRGKIFTNGFWDNIQGYNSVDVSSPINNFLSSKTNISIGRNFKGVLDEVGVYSKYLTNEEVAQLFESKKAIMIDYKKSLYKKSLSFDGENDYLQINQSMFSNPLSNFTIEIWVKFNEVPNSRNMTIFHVPNNAVGKETLNLRIINGSVIDFMSLHSGTQSLMFANYSFKKDTNYHLIFNFNGTSKAVYVNNELIKNISNSNALSSSNLNLYVGAKEVGIENFTEYFSGEVDELKVYSKALSKMEIEQNYYNYNTFGEGCCNYLLLINPNKFGYNDSTHNNNVSYSSRLFYDHYNQGLLHNITLYNLTNVSSNSYSENFYNFQFDTCLKFAYNIDEYTKTNNNVTWSWVTDPLLTADNDTCSSFVSLGIY